MKQADQSKGDIQCKAKWSDNAEDYYYCTFIEGHLGEHMTHGGTCWESKELKPMKPQPDNEMKETAQQADSRLNREVDDFEKWRARISGSFAINPITVSYMQDAWMTATARAEERIKDLEKALHESEVLQKINALSCCDLEDKLEHRDAEVKELMNQVKEKQMEIDAINSILSKAIYDNSLNFPPKENEK